MNDRIKELTKQAGFCFWEDEPWGPGEDQIDWGCDYTKELDTLIKLIINECVDVLGPGDGHWSKEKSIKQLCTHFGIDIK